MDPSQRPTAAAVTEKPFVAARIRAFLHELQVRSQAESFTHARRGWPAATATAITRQALATPVTAVDDIRPATAALPATIEALMRGPTPDFAAKHTV